MHLPTLNAALNSVSAIALCLGYLAIRRGKRMLHVRCMAAALLSSAAFLASYLVYHFRVGSVPYGGDGGRLLFYRVILLTHIVLATAIVPLVALTVVRAARGQFDRHRRIARWTLPLWLYVSVTG
ncbi:MAG: DUF420 domain-containing protein [Planctomycetes bacterium]|nr:DUF420 domain-containing protein [Planctomycetota bacterium]